MPFTSILYANGPGYVHINGTRGNITMVDYCKYRLMSFRCCTHLCSCAYRQLMWSRLTLAHVFLLKEKMKMMFMVFTVLPSDLFSAQASLFTCNALEKSYLYFFVEHLTAMIQFLLLLFCIIALVIA